MDRSTSSGDEDRDFARGSAHRREGNYNDGRQNNRQHNFFYYNQQNSSRDYDARSQSSQKSDPNSESSGRGDPTHYNPSATSSVGSYGSGSGDVNFRHAAISATHLLNGDPAHRFPPSLYQSSADAPKSDTATVCSSSMMEDIEDVGNHYDGDIIQTNNSKQHHHHYPPPSSLRRSNSKEGNRLVDFAERSQAVFPIQSKLTGLATGISQEASSASNNNDEEAIVGHATQHRKGMGPPLSRHWLMQHHGISPFRTGSVKSGGSYGGSDVVVNVGSDCGGSLTDVQSMLSQEDAALLSTVNSEISSEATPVTGSVATGNKIDTDASDNTISAMGAVPPAEDDEKKPHPLLCDQSGSKSGGRVSPGGTIYRGRGVRRYKGRLYGLPLKRFHQDGVHLHSDREPEGSSITTTDRLHQSSNHHQPRQRYNEDGDHYRWEDLRGGNLRDDYRRGGDNHNYHERDYNRDRSWNRSRSRSRSPPAEDRKRKAREKKVDFARGYKIDK